MGRVQECWQSKKKHVLLLTARAVSQGLAYKQGDEKVGTSRFHFGKLVCLIRLTEGTSSTLKTTPVTFSSLGWLGLFLFAESWDCPAAAVEFWGGFGCPTPGSEWCNTGNTSESLPFF